MTTYVFTKSQIDSLLKENNTHIIMETDFKSVISNTQEGDILFIERNGQENKKFKIKDVLNDNLFAIDTKNKVKVEIPKTGLDIDNNSITYTMVATQKGQRTKTAITIGSITSIYLLRNGEPIGEINVSEPSGGEDDDSIKKRTKKIEQRKKESIELLKNSSEGDIINITKGEFNEKEEIDESKSTKVELKIKEKTDETEAKIELKEAVGAEESAFRRLNEFDQVIIDDMSIKVDKKDPNKMDITLTVLSEGSTKKIPINDVILFDIHKGDEEQDKGDDEKGDDLSKEKGKKLSKKQLEILRKDPMFQQALQLNMEIDDIIKNLGGKNKKVRGKDRGKFKHKARMKFEWIGRSIGEYDFRLSEGDNRVGTYNLKQNRIRSVLPQTENEIGRRKLIFVFEDIQSTEKEDVYKVNVKVEHVKGNIVRNVMPSETGYIKIIDYNIND